MKDTAFIETFLLPEGYLRVVAHATASVSTWWMTRKPSFLRLTLRPPAPE